MPYRRLPNTDQARLRALKAAKKKGELIVPYELAFSQKLLLELQAFLPQFEQAISQYNFSKDRQAKYGRLSIDQFKSARLYVSHFLQVVNMGIIRGEMKPDVRTYYGLEVEDKSVPELTTEQALIHWGEMVIKGEEKRMMTGGSRIYNPSIAMVKVKYEKFVEYYNNHKDLLVTTEKMHDKVLELREKGDRLILNIWNEVEARFEDHNPEEKRAKSAVYGVVYLLRKHEKEQLNS